MIIQEKKQILETQKRERRNSIKIEHNINAFALQSTPMSQTAYQPKSNQFTSMTYIDPDYVNNASEKPAWKENQPPLKNATTAVKYQNSSLYGKGSLASNHNLNSLPALKISCLEELDRMRSFEYYFPGSNAENVLISVNQHNR